MTSLDDLPLDTGRGEAVVPPSASSSPGPRVVFFAVLALTLAAAVWIFVARTRQSAPPSPASTSTVPAAAAIAAGETPAATPLPPLGEMDPVVRGMLSALGTQPELLKWLATDDLVGSIATAIDRLSEGQSPARDLAALRPGLGFATLRRTGVTRVDPASYARYGPIVQAVSAVDAVKLAAAFSTLRPRIAEAYAAQGHPGGGFDEALARALGVVVSTPDVPADAALGPRVGGFTYANPAFEQLPPAQKHLLRMGPDNVRAVRDATKRFADAVGIAPATR